MNSQIANGNGGEVTGELCPLFASVDGEGQSGLGAHEKQIGLDQIFANHMRITFYGLGCEGGPGGAEIGGLVNVSVHVTGLVSIEGDVGGAGLVVTGFDAAHQRIARNARNIADEVLPSFPAVARELQIAVVGSSPDDFWIP